MPSHLIIEKFNKKGWGVAPGNQEVFGALPGEEVAVERMGRLKLLREVISPSADRVSPRCRHATLCGGCAFQHVSLPAQLREKERRVKEAIDFQNISPIIPCERPWHYRNKMEYTFSQNREGERFLGLLMAGGRGKVVDLKECYLVDPWQMEALERVRSWWEETGLAAYHFRSDRGHLRTLTLRQAKKGKLVMLTVSGNPEFALKSAHIKAFKALFPEEEISLFIQIHQIAKGRPTQFFEMHLKGPAHITETLNIYGRSLNFLISPTSFFQPNTAQAEKLYEAALSFIKAPKGALLYDLYCGTGTTSLVAASRGYRVVGIELNPHAVFDAGQNAEINGLDVIFHKGDVGQVLQTMSEKPDVVLVDPPRAGLDEKALSHLLRLKPKEILYISCNPTSQGENLKPLIEAGYQITAVQPVDQFPHTVHIENICHLHLDP